MSDSAIRYTETAYSEWGGEPRRDERTLLYQLITGPDAACANDPIRDRWIDSRYGGPFLAALCQQCPLREPCLDYALVNDVDGVWGGTTAAERRRLRGSIKPTPVQFTAWLE